ELRLLIEPPAAAKAAVLMSPEEFQGIAGLAAHMRDAKRDDAQSAYNAFAQEDARFHAAIAKASQNDLLHDIITQQRVHLHLFRLRFHARVTEDAIVEHARILEAFAQQDAAGAAAAMRIHIENAHARFKTVFEG
ncbi:MAG: GntR family transcriptional regulator, partial [Rhizobiales bacterium 35-66-30]